MNSRIVSLHSATLSLLSAAAFLLPTPDALAQCCGRVSQNQPRIVGGSTAPRGAYPWMVAMVERGQTPSNGQFCGGALIAPGWVLTAAHCVEGSTAARTDVIIGAYNLSETNGSGQRVQVTQIISHPSYGDVNGTLSNDVALLKLATPVTNVPVLRLVDNASRFATGMACRGIGFGATSEGGSGSNVLLQVDMAFVSQATANQVYGGITDAHLAAGMAGGGRDTCQGDSGGPLLVPDGAGGWMVAGVVSFGDGCARPGIPGIYANVLKYTPWINQHIGVQPPPPPTDDYGNTVATAATGTLGNTIAGKLESTGDIDVIKFAATGAGSLTATSTGTTALIGQWLNSAGTAMGSNTGAPNFTLTVPISTAGNYYLAVKGRSTTTIGSYSVKATFTAAPPVGAPEMDLSGSVALVDGDIAPTVAKGTDFGSGNVGSTISKIFTIQNTGTANLTVGAVQLSGAGAANFSVSVQPASTVAPARSATFTIAFAPKSAGVGVADVTISNNDANENPYNFRITGTGIAVAPSDDHGNTSATATVVAAPGSRAGRLEKSGDVDFFKFTIAARTTLTLKSTGSIDTYATLYNSAGSVVTEVDDISSSDLNFSIRRTFAAGTYYLKVEGYDDTVTGAYTFAITK